MSKNNDDIVTRLRDVMCCCAESYLTDDCDACKAADEIERLRYLIEIISDYIDIEKIFGN